MAELQTSDSLASKVLDELSKFGITLRFPNPKALEMVRAEDLVVEERVEGTSLSRLNQQKKQDA